MALFLRLIRVFMGLFTLIFSYVKILKLFSQNDIDDGLEENVTVVRVSDGDTYVVRGDDGEFKIRLIGVDTPETQHPNKDVEFFGIEAKKKINELILGKNVILARDESQEDIDKYERKLRYVFLENGVNFNKWLILNGYANEYTYDKPYKLQEEFLEAEKSAEKNKIGIWSDELYDNFLMDQFFNLVKNTSF